MKRMYFIVTGLLLMLFITTSKTNAQDWQVLWQKKVHPTPAFTWMKDTLSFTGLAYDRMRDRLYVVSPRMLNGKPDPHIYILDPSNGDSLGEFPIDHSIIYSGLSSGKYCLYKIQVADDGRIYACNLVSPIWEICYPGPPPNCDPKLLNQGAFKIFKWDTPQSNPKIVYSTPAPASDTAYFGGGMTYTRWGDAFAVKGAYDSTLIFVSGGDPSGRNMSSEFDVFQANDTVASSFSLVRKVQCGINGLASQGIAATGTWKNNPVWVDSYTGPASLQTQDPVSINIATIPIPMTGASGPIRYFALDQFNRNFIVVADGKNIANQDSTSARVIDVTIPDTAYPVLDRTPPLGNYSLQICSGTKNWVSDVDYYWTGYGLRLYVLMSGNGIAAFSSFDPVELASFEANVFDNTVQLQWRTATETNNQGFEIERRIKNPVASGQNSQTWERIGFIKGFGTTTEPHEYTFDDPIQNIQKNIHELSYRLKQIDYNGTIEYSPVTTVYLFDSNDKSFQMDNYPNPFNTLTIINCRLPIEERAGAFFKIYDVFGREVLDLSKYVISNWSFRQGESSIVIRNSDLPSPGIYFYQLISPGIIQTKKMILL